MAQGRLDIIGFGNMGAAIADGLVAAGEYMAPDIHVYDIDADKRDHAEKAGYFAHATLDGVAEAEMVILAVKPTVLPSVLDKLGDMGDTPVVSIAAGVKIALLESYLPATPVIRVMPNTPCLVGAGVSVMAAGTHATNEHLARARNILSAIGFVSIVDESLMDAVTGLSGSGPAYVAMVIDALSDGGVRMGLSREDALKLAAQTVYGTAKMVLDRGVHPARLRDMVTSPGGTTIEGVAALEAHGIRAAFIDAVEAATEKSKELGS